MPLRFDSASRLLSSFLSHCCVLLFCCDDLARCAVRFIRSLCRTGLVCYEPLRNACYLPTCRLACFRSLKTNSVSLGCIMKRKKRQSWQACGLKLWSGKSSPWRALLLGLWNVLRLKTVSLWDLGRAAAVLPPCSCENGLKQAAHAVLAILLRACWR